MSVSSRRRVVLVCVSLCVMSSFALHAAQALTLPPDYTHKSPPTFLDDTRRNIRRFIQTTTSLTARASSTRRAVGVRHPVHANCDITYTAPSNLCLIVKGVYPYTVTVVTGIVTTTFPHLSKKDVRPLHDGEKAWDHFLGISCYDEDPAFLLRFDVDDDTYFIYATRREESVAALRRDPVKNAWRVLQRMIRIDSRTGALRETHMTTLAGEETHLFFHSVHTAGGPGAQTND